MKYLKRILGIFVAILVLIAVIPVSAFAVDPVSAVTMANAFAQAVTAYGASHGVSMMFDVSNTSGIGEQVHELWQRFRSDQQTADDYATIASAVWPGLYSKVQRVAGAVVGINLAAEYVAELDGFWNWLLSGPAEMVKVDDQYYQWTLDNQDQVIPIVVNSSSTIAVNGVTCYSPPFGLYDNYNRFLTYTVDDSSTSQQVYYFTAKQYPETNGYWVWAFSADHNPFRMTGWQDGVARATVNVTNAPSGNGYWYCYQFTVSYGQPIPSDPVEWNGSYISNYLGQYNASNVGSPDVSSISVQPYIGDSVPQDIYIPDNEDVNYAPLPASIPLDIPWDDSLYGDGQTLTDAQSEAIAGASDLVISDTGTLELADTASPPAPSPNEVYIPLLPVQLPSFNFSFSGIWHYVVSWVQSLGSWFSLMFQTWAALPYAITLPVYATAVVVIIIGTLKRFL